MVGPLKSRVNKVPNMIKSASYSVRIDEVEEGSDKKRRRKTSSGVGSRLFGSRKENC